MRSRYTAFVVGASAYLLATWHPSQRPTSIDMPAGIRWLGLDLRKFGKMAPEVAAVEFIARYVVDGKSGCLHETSRFFRVDQRWYYVDGEIH